MRDKKQKKGGNRHEKEGAGQETKKKKEERRGTRDKRSRNRNQQLGKETTHENQGARENSQETRDKRQEIRDRGHKPQVKRKGKQARKDADIKAQIDTQGYIKAKIHTYTQAEISTSRDTREHTDTATNTSRGNHIWIETCRCKARHTYMLFLCVDLSTSATVDADNTS